MLMPTPHTYSTSLLIAHVGYTYCCNCSLFVGGGVGLLFDVGWRRGRGADVGASEERPREAYRRYGSRREEASLVHIPHC